VLEVEVQAIERRGSKVRVLADARRMLGDVWAVRAAVAKGTYGGVQQHPAGEPRAEREVEGPGPVAPAVQSVLPRAAVSS
jgi:hypothetical protein